MGREKSEEGKESSLIPVLSAGWHSGTWVVDGIGMFDTVPKDPQIATKGARSKTDAWRQKDGQRHR